MSSLGVRRDVCLPASLPALYEQAAKVVDARLVLEREAAAERAMEREREAAAERALEREQPAEISARTCRCEKTV